MADLFNRKFLLNLGGTKIEGLRVDFEVVRDIRPEPDSLNLKIYNLSAENRTKFQDKETVVELSAGYEENIELIFRGKVDQATSSKQGVDWITVFTSGDGLRQYRNARVNISLKKGTKLKDALKQIFDSLGVAAGGALKKIEQGDFRGGYSEFVNGGLVTGKASEELDALLKTYGKEWFIQNGEAIIVNRGQTTSESAVLLKPSSGLIGSPEVGDDGAVKAVSLLQPGLRPGRKAKIEAGAIDGFYRIERSVHRGTTHGQDWYSEIEGKPL